jgi:hypothetical protein
MAITYHAGRRIQGLAATDVTVDSTTNTTWSTVYSTSSTDMTHYGGEHFTATKWRNLDLKSFTIKYAKYGSGSGTHLLKVFGSDHSTQIGSTITGSPSSSSSTATESAGGTDVTFDLTGITSPNTEWFIGVGVSGTQTSNIRFNNAAAGDGSNFFRDVNGYTDYTSQSAAFTLVYVGGDTKPTDVQVGSRFEATDTRKMYHYNSPTLTFEHDYSDSIGWIEVGTTSNITGGVWTSNGAGNNADHGFYKALGFTLSDSAWYVEFDIKQTAGGTTVASGVPLFFSAGTAKSLDTSHDALGITATSDGTKPVQAWKNTAGTAGTGSGATTLTHGTQYYGVLIRTSTTNLQLKYYTDSARTSQHGSTVDFTISSGITGLNTIQHRTTDNGSTSSGTSNIIDNVKIYNGVTSLDNVWSELGT